MFTIRTATVADIPVIVQHRIAMFDEMGVLPGDAKSALAAASTRYLEPALVSGEYVGWLASPSDGAEDVIAGAGVQRRTILPRPIQSARGTTIAHGREAIVLNVYTEPVWRRRGVARLLMREVLAWTRASDVEVLVLHASDAGRALYEELGFVPSNEMRYGGHLT
jgi:GNAT superfamily N-acetyltransferase